MKQPNMEAVAGEILMVPFFGQGHLFPSMELCKHISSRNYTTILIIPSHLSSSIPSSLRRYPLVEIYEMVNSSPPPEPTAPPPPPPTEMRGPGHNPFHHHNQELGQSIEAFLSGRYPNPDLDRPACAIIDVMMSWSKEIFAKFMVPAVSFFTSGACSAAMEYAAWKAHVEDMKPGEIHSFPGLPEDMTLSYSDLHRRSHRPPPGQPEPGRLDGPMGRMRPGPPGPGQRPRWLDEVDGSIALLINTCNNLEHSFINYLASRIGKPVWAVGPLLPEQYWKSVDSVLRDRVIRPNRRSNCTEDEVIQWLDSKPRRSVIYVSFGSEVGPTMEEYAELAKALEETNRPFIWVIQPGSGKPGPPPGPLTGRPDSNEGYCPQGLEDKVGDRSLIIRGWAPQLMILTHPSTSGFVSHCGWNSTVEAIGRGVPILAWPIRGDQFCNAKLVVGHLKVGCMVSNDPSDIVKKDDVLKGIERLMVDEEIHAKAKDLRRKFGSGFPASSVVSLDAFVDLISRKIS